MTTDGRGKAPWRHRFLVGLLAASLAVLIAWLLGIVLRDIGSIQGPSWEAFETRHVDAALLDRRATLRDELATVRRRIEAEREIRANASSSRDAAKASIDQLIELHRLSIAKGLEPPESAQKALEKSQELFMEHQERIRTAGEELDRLSGRRRELEEEIARVETRLETQREPAREAFEKAVRRHELRVAAIQLASIVPVFLLASWLVWRARGSPWRVPALAFLGAAAWRLGGVMHMHLPAAVFRYIAIGVATATVLAALAHLIRRALRPREDWLIDRYREAYQRHRCPICDQPMQRGPLRWARWSRRGPVALGAGLRRTPPAEEGPYTCPACGTRLFVPCEHCGANRHALLPYCASCGQGPSLPAAGSDASPAPRSAGTPASAASREP